jgi:hypothetical protein
VVAAGGYLKALLGTGNAGDAIDKAVFAGDAARPPFGQILLEWFRFAKSLKR